jgi:hypothetical protein
MGRSRLVQRQIAIRTFWSDQRHSARMVTEKYARFFSGVYQPSVEQCEDNLKMDV